MPNHVTNILKFTCTDEQFKKLAEALKVKGSFPGSVDFNKLIPMPASLNVEAGSRGNMGLKLYNEYITECVGVTDQAKLDSIREKYRDKVKDDPEILDLGKQYFDNIDKYGAPTWYEWCSKNWGTKWNAYDCQPVTPDDHTLTFCTAWSAVPEIVDLISKKIPTCEVKYSWADEDIGNNVGSVTLKNGELLDMDIPDPDSKEAIEMSASIMGADPADWGLSLAADGSTYEYREEEPVADVPAPAAPAKSKGETR